MSEKADYWIGCLKRMIACREDEMSALAHRFDDYKVEVHNGVEVAMSPSAGVYHNLVVSNVVVIFKNYLKGKPCTVFTDGVDVKFSKKDTFVPDAMVVCNKNIIKADAIYGTPDLVVEVLSPSTARYDKGYKKRMYENYGVLEYWMIDPISHTIEVNVLTDGKYELLDVYYLPLVYEHYDDEDNPRNKTDWIREFSPTIFPELVIQVMDVFEGCDE